MNLLNYLGIGRKKYRGLRGRIIEPRPAIFKERTGIIKPASLEGLSWSIADFTKHARSVLNGTGYIINRIVERGDIYGGYYAQIEIHKVRMGPIKFLGHQYAGTIALTTTKKKPKINVNCNSGGNLKDYEIRLKDYDLSRLIKADSH